ncbi:amidohydrolase family protein [Streptomyces sp. BBFR2]|uniref:metal-dependent hydrolase family protein n=1 Tax=Streptomyces sp. BBFR2 TaxID=3372854 RepID=UPI0037DA54BD
MGTGSAPSAEDIVLVAEKGWDGTSEQPTGHIEVRISDGKITDVGPRVDRGGAQVIDLGDRMLLPGFIDCHIHSSLDPANLLEASVNESPAEVALRSLPTLNSLVNRGFTTVRDLAAAVSEPVTVYLRDAIEHGIVRGPRMIVAPHIISARAAHGDMSGLVAPGYGLDIGAVADGPAEIMSMVRKEVRFGAEWIKFGATGGFATPSDDPSQVTYSQEEMNALVSTATDLGIPCTPHAYGDEGVRRAVEAGVRSIDHGNLASDETLAMMEDKGVFLVPTQFMVNDALDNLDNEDYWIGKTTAERRKFRHYHDQLRACARTVAASNVRIAFGTDAGMFPHDNNWREFGAMVNSGITPVRALRAATSTAADLLQRPDLGRLATGCTADVIAIPGDPFQDIDATGAVDFVIKEGTTLRLPEC